jgi:hypothetical protein
VTTLGLFSKKSFGQVTPVAKWQKFATKNSGLESSLKELLGGQLPIWLSTYIFQFETIGLTICLCAKPCTNTKK